MMSSEPTDNPTEQATEQATEQQGDGTQPDDDGQDRIDRSAIDFDPDDGLYTGTAVEGTSRIPGPHEKGDDTSDEEAGPGESGQG
jgi:hypothetical protein